VNITVFTSVDIGHTGQDTLVLKWRKLQNKTAFRKSEGKTSSGESFRIKPPSRKVKEKHQVEKTLE